MTSTERFKIVMDILNESEFGNCYLYHSMFERLRDEELSDKNKVQEILKLITEYENRRDNEVNKYPEHIMRYLRQRRGLDEFDTSCDKDINTYSPSEAFADVCAWNGLGGSYDYTIKGWIKDIYDIELE